MIGYPSDSLASSLVMEVVTVRGYI